MKENNKEVINQDVEKEIISEELENNTVENSNKQEEKPNNIEIIDEDKSFPQEKNETLESYPVEKSKKLIIFFVIIIFLSIVILISFFLNNYFKEKKNSENITPNIQSNKDQNKNDNNKNDEKEEYEPEVVDNVSVINVSTNILNSAADEDYYFNDSVFIGDEIVRNFEIFKSSKAPNFLGSPKFLTSNKLTLNTLISPISNDSDHPIYNNEKTLVEDFINKKNIKKAYIMLGYNDIINSGVTKSLSNYKTLINRIKSKNSSIKIYLINVGYMYKGTETKEINNALLRDFNTKISSSATSWGVTIINFAHAIINKNGYLEDAYTSDKTRLINNIGYNILTNILRTDARVQIENNLINNATNLVINVESNPTYDNYNKAVIAVNNLPEGLSKKDFLKRLNVVNDLLIKNYSNKLTDISLNGVSISLVKDKYTYEISYANNVSEVAVIVKKESTNAIVEGADTYKLNYGDNKINLNVKNNNETVTYTINIKRAYDTTIKSVKVDDTLIENIDNLIYQTDYSVESVILNVIGNDPDATITGTGTIPLNVGENKIEFSVNGATYFITITRNAAPEENSD